MMRLRLLIAAIAFTGVVLVVGACGGGSRSGSGAEEPEALEEWHTEQTWVLVSKQRCVTGPFTVEVPRRETEFGRRFVIEVFGQRGLPMDTRRVYPDGTIVSGWGWSEEGLGELLGDHSACRAGDDDVELPVVAEGEGGEPSGTGKPGRPPGTRKPGKPGDPGDPGGGKGRKPPGKRKPGKPGDPGGGTHTRRRRGGGPGPVEVEVEVEVPTLDIYTGGLPNTSVHASATAWYPLGNPNFYGIDDISSHHWVESGDEPFQFQFWFHRPVDMDGVVIRFRDQVLVPKGPIGPYRAGFAARVAEVERRMAALKGVPVIRADPHHQDDAARGKLPPPPRKEVIPEAPGDNVQWVAGYWKYHAQLEDFVWIEGTFVVRAPPEPPPVAAAPPEVAAPAETPPPVQADDPPPPEQPDEDEPEGEVAQPLDERVPPKPAPRREVIPPPPAVAGAIWVPGYWRLHGTTWRWVAGRWHVRRKRGERFRPPSVEVRGGVKIYLPGGWTIRRR
ncbi:hypothetical protein [Haliangium sp.]|uniref:hypothetical protein n=1 Tax=Haliangium sp. TaxID=2663208 RepID=UPI003D0E6A90